MLLLFMMLSTPAFAAMECDTTTEDAIKTAIADNPTKLVRVLAGQDLAGFLSALTANGYLIGTLENVDHIYIVDAGKRPGYTSDNVWLFFVQEGCLIRAIPASKSVVVAMLP